jgi:hypothetical protein
METPEWWTVKTTPEVLRNQSSSQNFDDGYIGRPAFVRYVTEACEIGNKPALSRFSNHNVRSRFEFGDQWSLLWSFVVII